MANANIFHLGFLVVVILLSSQQTQMFGFEPYIAAVSRNNFCGAVFTNCWKFDFLIRKIRWSVSTIYLGSNGFKCPARQKLTTVSSSWEVHTDSRTLGQVCVLPASRDGHPCTATENNLYREQFLTSGRQQCLLHFSRDEKPNFCVFMPKS